MARIGAASLFFSYSHKDEALRDHLEAHLSVLQRQGLIQPWHDRRITPGSDLHGAIDAHLESADIILLLVSPDFLASDYCYDKEMARALERHDLGEATVLPVILRPCDWLGSPLGRLVATPTDGRPVTLWPNIDQAFLEITTAIKSALQKRGNVIAPSSTRAASGPSGSRLVPREGARAVAAAMPEVRSSNLRLSKRFTQRDRDLFLHDAFEYIAKFFEGSLRELTRRNAGVEHTFRRIDANRFTASVYRDGDARARCSIFLGGLGFSSHDIAFSYGDSGATNSYNERLTVEADDQALFLRALVNSATGRQAQGEKLTPEGGAELLWGMFIEPLQRG